MRRHLKGIIICTTLFCIFVNLIIYLSADTPEPPVLQPAEPVQRRPVVIPELLRGGRRNPLHAPLAADNWKNDWFRSQELNPETLGDLKKEAAMDLVYTWVNGTEPALQDMKEYYKDLSPLFQALKALPEGSLRQNNAGRGRNGATVDKNADQTVNRFRDMNELKYSLRSVIKYGASNMFRKIHILTTEVVVDQRTGEKRGQVPQWLDLDRARDKVDLITHSEIYDDKEHLPSFNSLSIESQMHHVRGLTDIFVYLNDDMFFGMPVDIADFWTPLYGFVFRMDPLTKIPPHPPKPLENTAVVGEWQSLQYTNSILAKQFGARHRVYIAHIPHVLSVPLMEEIQATWPEEFNKTSSHRFRGEGFAHEIQVSYLLSHYTMERLRETQLTSWWRYRLDKNQDGLLDWEEREELIRMVRHYDNLQAENQKVMPDLVKRTFVSGLKDHDRRLENVGISWTNRTTYFLTGMDEYPFMLAYGDLTKSSRHQFTKPYLIQQYQRKCKFEIDFCLGPEFRNSSIPFVDAMTGKGSVFERLAFTEFHCGDCLLHIVRQSSPNPGMSALMPLDQNSKAYGEVLRDLAKYNYVVGHSAFSFLQLKSGMQAESALNTLMRQWEKQAFFCINDDVQDNPLIIERVKKFFSNFLNLRFPEPSPYEKE
ncbi:Xanthine phosphoribosyltransferase 1 [Gamsiella multidivaricata]|nr:Xanthine phosphoribosyltransferase 1 [Gamsiella multidivaricata]